MTAKRKFQERIKTVKEIMGQHSPASEVYKALTAHLTFYQKQLDKEIKTKEKKKK